MHCVTSVENSNIRYTCQTLSARHHEVEIYLSVILRLTLNEMHCTEMAVVKFPVTTMIEVLIDNDIHESCSGMLVVGNIFLSLGHQ